MSSISRISRLDEKLATVSFPSLQEFSTIELGKEDIFILAAGFEDRVMSCIKKVYPKDKFYGVIVVNYAPDISQNLFDDILGFCENKKLSYESIQYDRNAPHDFIEKLKSNALIQSCKGNIYIDISCMSRLLIIQVIYALKKFISNLIILYTEAEIYSPTFDDFKNEMEKSSNDEPLAFPMFISSGVADIVFPPEFSSSALQGQPSRLIVFPSFNSYQLRSVISELQPNYLEIIHGKPLRNCNLWRLDAIKRLNHIEAIKQSKKEHVTSTFDYRETLTLLLSIYKEENVFNQLTIIPTGSKLQALAVAIFRLFMEDVRIAYPTPHGFNDVKNYTNGVLSSYMINLSFLQDVVQAFPSLTTIDYP